MASSPDPQDASGPQGAALREAKRALRQRVLAERDALPADARAAASAAIVSRMRRARRFLGRADGAADAPVSQRMGHARRSCAPRLDAGKTVAAPRVDDATRMLELHAIADPRARCRPEPAGHSRAAFPLPADRPGRDRFRRRSRRRVRSRRASPGLRRRLLRSAAAAACRRAPRASPAPSTSSSSTRVPVGPHDIAVDAIVTESRELSVRR